MILEARVRKAEKSSFARIDDKEMTIKQRPGDSDYSNVYHRLRDDERIFIIPISKGECHLIVNFNNGMEDYFFQRMFGNEPPKRKKMSFYQTRIVAAKNAIKYQY
ncbi:hypothetical protein KY343_01050 [Candidatus Woesearchaeota archaeon]|nr:hypothetical protein [Candidatus Woesearchaeota archaeon]